MACTQIALERNYQGYSTLLDVLLGANHHVSLHFCAFVESFQYLRWRSKSTLARRFMQRYHYFNDILNSPWHTFFNGATVHAANAGLPRVNDLINRHG
jgi:hypothetical protein